MIGEIALIYCNAKQKNSGTIFPFTNRLSLKVFLNTAYSEISLVIAIAINVLQSAYRLHHANLYIPVWDEKVDYQKAALSNALANREHGRSQK